MKNKVLQVLQVIKVLQAKKMCTRRLTCNTCNTCSTFYTFRGFSIVELLVYMALMSIFLVVLLDIFTTTLNSKLSSESTSTLNQDSRYILSKLSYDLNNADSVTSPLLGSMAGSLQIVTGGVTSTYASSSGKLVLTTGGVGMNLNSLDTSIDNISFKNIGNAGGKPTVQVTYTLKSNIDLPGGNRTQSVNTTVGLR